LKKKVVKFFLDDKRKIQLENRDQRKKELDRMQREKTAQNGTIFARQQKAIEEQHDEEVNIIQGGPCKKTPTRDSKIWIKMVGKN